VGKIEDALRRSSADPTRGIGAPTQPSSPSPWRFDQRGPTAPPPPWHFDEPEDAGGAGLEFCSAPSVVPADDGEAGLEPCPVPASVQPSTDVEVAAEPPEPPAAGSSASVSPRFDATALERLVVSKTAGALLVEQFRSLAATLLSAQREHPLRSIIVSSASPGDGKSHVALNLALTLSESYQRRVLLIDADLRRPSLHRVFRLPNVRGLTDALKVRADEKVAAVQVSDRLTLLPAGQAGPNPLGALSSPRMKHIVEEAASRFDWVIVDSPPVGVLADGRLVSEAVDAAILVVRAGVTRFPELEAAADAVGRERILGIVLNGVDPVDIRSQSYYGHYYGREPAAK
jgi:protein-tyrosine kinase